MEATGWPLEYVAGLPLPEFWRLHLVLARRPSAARMSRVVAGVERPDEERSSRITRADVEQLRRLAAGDAG